MGFTTAPPPPLSCPIAGFGFYYIHGIAQSSSDTSRFFFRCITKQLVFPSPQMVKTFVKAKEMNVEGESSGNELEKISAVVFDFHIDALLCNGKDSAQVALKDCEPLSGTGKAILIGRVASVKGIQGFDLQAAKKKFFEVYLDKAKPDSGIEFPNGVLELISECKRKGIKVAVAANARHVKVKASLVSAGVLSVFDTIVLPDTFDVLKPGTDIFLVASEILNVPPNECIVIEVLFAEVEASEAERRHIVSTTTSSEEMLQCAGPSLTRNNLFIDCIPSPKLSRKRILGILNIACSNSICLRQAHAIILRSGHFQDHYVSGTLLKFYSNPQFKNLGFSIKVFNQIPRPNIFVWNILLRGCLANHEPCKVISFYFALLMMNSIPNKFTYPTLFKACTRIGAIEEGLQVHVHVIKHGFFHDGHIRSAGIQMYSSLGLIRDAKKILDEGKESDDIICWNAMIDGYLKHGNIKSAQQLFDCMPDRNVSSWNTMISGLSRCGMIRAARDLFNTMKERDEISWSAIIDGYIKEGSFKEVLAIFVEMQRKNVRPGKFILSSVLTACANLGALDQGRWIHSYIRRNSIQLDAVLGTALIDMYAKCGRLDMAWEVFENMKMKEVDTWNSMIGGLAMHGRSEDAMVLFTKMRRDKLKPNGITFVGILNACAHAGMVNRGLTLLNSMKTVYGIEPQVEHYGCVVDLLGRAGRLAEAEDFINSMPIKPNAAVWGALLGACRIHGEVALGERVGRILIEIEPHNSGRYTLLSNIYAKAGRWDDVGKIRKLMKDRGVKTIPGSSMMDLGGVIHEFKMGDVSHPQTKEIYSMLESILERLKMEGYSPNTSLVSFDTKEEEKEAALMYHSEKVSVAFGLLNTKPGTTLRIMKNLRVCEDCHSAMKLISQIYKRDIIMRDRARYHHFRNGNCSCDDYW